MHGNCACHDNGDLLALLTYLKVLSCSHDIWTLDYDMLQCLLSGHDGMWVVHRT